jgi:TPM domain
MLHSLFRAGLAMGLFGLLLVPGTASAQDRRVRHVQDEAGLFGKDAIEQANRTIKEISDHHHKDLFIETVEKGPEDKVDRAKWSHERFQNAKVNGVYVVFSKHPAFYRIEVGNNTREEGYFTKANVDALVEDLNEMIKEKKGRDAMLKKITSYTLETMDKHPRKKAGGEPAPRQAPVVHDAPAPVHVRGGDNHPNWLSAILPWVCLIVGGLVVVWIIFAIIRALTGMGGGGYGYGGGYGGGMMGGGGGFFTGMLGGLFGSMAGMWIYNNMFGGHASYMPNGQVDWGGGGNQGAAGNDGDTDTSGAGGGGDGDWGDNGGGADAGGGKGDDGGDGGGKGGDDDAGGGGGDWGGGGDAGGGDAGGGGDWGGGGDAGGDWGGGGGGGDFGGGGGDFGGGGGGGCGGGGGGGDW